MLRNVAIMATVALGTLLVWPAPPGERLVKVYGDLTTADRVAIIVPGADTTVATFDTSTRHPGGAARALLAEASRLAPRERLAAVAWLGYDSPPTMSLAAAMDDAAVRGATDLRRAVLDLRARVAAPITLLCHSYGSALCAKAAPGLPISDMALFGSPGISSPPVAALPHPAPRVWAGVGDNDWIRFVPKVKIGCLGFGIDPTGADYGARLFDAGPGSHSDYYNPGTVSLRNLTLIALGRHEEVSS